METNSDWYEVTDGFASGFLTALSSNGRWCISDCGIVGATLNSYELFDFCGTIEYNRKLNSLRIREYEVTNGVIYHTKRVYTFTNGRK